MSVLSEQQLNVIYQLETAIREGRARGENVARLEADLLERQAEFSKTRNLVSESKLLKG